MSPHHGNGMLAGFSVEFVASTDGISNVSIEKAILYAISNKQRTRASHTRLSSISFRVI